METIWYHAAYADGVKHLKLCPHQHPTVISAVACMSAAGEYVVAVEKGVVRGLTRVEEVEYDYAIYGRKLGQPISPPFGYRRRRFS